MYMAYIIAAVITVAIWIPNLIRFYRTWTKRRNPVSLAIFVAIALIIWEVVARTWVVTSGIEGTKAAFLFTGVSAIVGIYLNASFMWAKKKFPNDRRGS